jgi:uncharacterized protein DUF4386
MLNGVTGFFSIMYVPSRLIRVFFRGAGFLSVFDQPQRDALAMLFLRLHGSGIGIAEILWGPFFIPFGLLVMRSGFLPRILGILLIAASFGYLADSLTSLLLPSYGDLVNRFAGILTGPENCRLWRGF